VAAGPPTASCGSIAPLLAEGHESVAYVIKQKRRDVPAMVDARGLLGPFEKLAWGLGRLWAKLSRLHLKPVGVYDFDAEANFPAEPIIRAARTRSEKWDLVLNIGFDGNGTHFNTAKNHGGPHGICIILKVIGFAQF
jgi:hypothetical protein